MSQVILLVDDDDVLGQVLSRILTRQGFNVCRATTAAQALQAAQECRPRLALLDLCLPDGDGVQLARRLRTQDQELALILMTAFPLRLRDKPGSAELFQHVLTKPLNLQELRGAVESASAESAANASPLLREAETSRTGDATGASFDPTPSVIR